MKMKPISQQDHEQTIEVFLRIQDAMLRTARKAALDGKTKHPSDIATPFNKMRASIDLVASHVFGHMRTARLFEFDANLLSTLTVSFLNEIAHDRPGYNCQRDDEGIIDARLAEMAASAKLPDAMPFDCIYFGFGPGVQAMIGAFMQADLPPELKAQADKISPVLTSYLVMPNGDVASFAFVFTENTAKVSILPVMERVAGRWINPPAMAHLMIPWLIEFINEHNAIVDERGKFSYREKFKKKAKELKITNAIPPPYYKIPLPLPDIIRSSVRKKMANVRRVIERQHRYDRRGHKRILVRRGALPLKPEDAVELRKRGYEVYTTAQPKKEIIDELHKKGHRSKLHDEWMAVKVVQVPPQLQIPYDRTDLPYIPGVRVPDSRLSS